jgi:hypothetical protein
MEGHTRLEIPYYMSFLDKECIESVSASVLEGVPTEFIC